MILEGQPVGARRLREENQPMQDLLCIVAMVGLLAGTLAYIRLCDHA